VGALGPPRPGGRDPRASGGVRGTPGARVLMGRAGLWHPVDGGRAVRRHGVGAGGRSAGRNLPRSACLRAPSLCEVLMMAVCLLVTGVDIVEPLVRANQQRLGHRPELSFGVMDIVKDVPPPVRRRLAPPHLSRRHGPGYRWT
jgi:hypothetical protein